MTSAPCGVFDFRLQRADPFARSAVAVLADPLLKMIEHE